MNVTSLVPKPTNNESFLRSRERYIPEKPGCYALTTITGHVLYIGLATDLRQRLNQHLDAPEKTGLTAQGRATLVYWYETAETNKVERTWLNIHQLSDGGYPLLNKIYSPTAT